MLSGINIGIQFAKIANALKFGIIVFFKSTYRNGVVKIMAVVDVVVEIGMQNQFRQLKPKIQAR